MQRLSPLQNGMVGTIAGACEVMCFQPMLYCKNATQQGLALTLDPRVLYRGVVMSIGNMALLTAAQFPLTAMFTRMLTVGESRPLEDWEQLASGLGGGAVSGLLCCPMELVMIQQQRFGTSLIGTPTKLIQADGVAALSRGLLTSVGREGIFTMGYMGLGPLLARKLRSYEVECTTAKIFGAIGAGMFAATLSHPVDTIKTCMQGDMQRERFGSLSRTAQELYRAEGLSAFFRGWSWRTGRMIGAVFVLGELKERLSPILFPEHFADVEL